jgi:hypothetical protein
VIRDGAAGLAQERSNIGGETVEAFLQNTNETIVMVRVSCKESEPGSEWR